MDSQDKVAVTEESVLKRRTWYFEKVPHKENIRETRQRIEERTGGRILHQKKMGMQEIGTEQVQAALRRRFVC